MSAEFPRDRCSVSQAPLMNDNFGRFSLVLFFFSLSLASIVPFLLAFLPLAGYSIRFLDETGKEEKQKEEGKRRRRRKKANVPLSKDERFNSRACTSRARGERLAVVEQGCDSAACSFSHEVTRRGHGAWFSPYAPEQLRLRLIGE